MAEQRAWEEKSNVSQKVLEHGILLSRRCLGRQLGIVVKEGGRRAIASVAVSKHHHREIAVLTVILSSYAKAQPRGQQLGAAMKMRPRRVEAKNNSERRNFAPSKMQKNVSLEQQQV